MTLRRKDVKTRSGTRRPGKAAGTGGGRPQGRGGGGPRPPLDRERVVRAAAALADEGGLEALSMRRLAEALGVEAMSLYHHVPGKEALLDGLVDLVFGELPPVPAGAPWRPALRQRAASLREALLRHRWALGILESRASPGPATLGHHEAVLGLLRGAGFTVAGAAHAYALVDSYVYGFALQELHLPFGGGEGVAQVAEAFLQHLPGDRYPRLAEMAAQHVMRPGYTFGDEFGFGLDLILDGLARLRRAG